MTAYLTTVELMDEMPDVEWSGKYEPLLEGLILRASRLIDRITGREEGAYQVAAATTRTFDGSGQRFQWVDEMAEAPTAVAVDESGTLSYTAWAGSDYMAWPYNAAAKGLPYLRLDIDQLNGTKVAWWSFPRSVRVTAKWGYSVAVPSAVQQAVIVQTVRWFKRGQQAFQDAGAIFELGQLRYVKQLDPDVALIVEHYRRVTV